MQQDFGLTLSYLSWNYILGLNNSPRNMVIFGVAGTFAAAQVEGDFYKLAAALLSGMIATEVVDPAHPVTFKTVIKITGAQVALALACQIILGTAAGG